MKVKIISDAKDKYIRDNTYYGSFEGTDYWENIMEKIQGKELEVDTSILFKDEFNLKPVDNLFEEEIRIEIDYVEKIIDDVREGMAYCELCNENSTSLEVCTNCGNENYLIPLIDDEDEYY